MKNTGCYVAMYFADENGKHNTTILDINKIEVVKEQLYIYVYCVGNEWLPRTDKNDKLKFPHLLQVKEPTSALRKIRLKEVYKFRGVHQVCGLWVLHC